LVEPSAEGCQVLKAAKPSSNFLARCKMETPFPHTFLIHLPDRTDRLRSIKKEFAEWPVSIEQVTGVKKTPGWKGCTQSHRKCIQLAQERDYPWVLVVEDDCKLEERAFERFVPILEFLWTRKDWDIFNGGMCYLNKDSVSIVNKDLSIAQAKGVCTQFVLFPKRSYKKILSDLSPIEPIVRIDEYYKDNFDHIWTVHPFLTTQRNDRSSITGTRVSKSNTFRQGQRAIKRRLKKTRKN